MRLDYFNYELPAKLIAQKPTSPRDACRLMLVDKKMQQLNDHHFYDLETLLHPGDVLVFNDSKVIPARIIFLHEEKKIELLLIREIDQDRWLVMGKPGKLLQKNKTFQLPEGVSFQVEEILPDGTRIIKFLLEKDHGKNLEEALEKIGKAPFPPYIKNPQASFQDYQTIYAEKKGSVAAPTAGLHFTNRLLRRLESRGIQLEFVTLHVGLGTFQPVKTKNLEEHAMHEELFQLDFSTAQRLWKAHQEGRRLIAVGTTSVRVLESAFKPGQGFTHGFQRTSIYIYPGYHWQCTDGLITNFHLPKSTLLLLTCSFGGKGLILKAYREAVKKHYRFYSFGDAMLIL